MVLILSKKFDVSLGNCMQRVKQTKLHEWLSSLLLLEFTENIFHPDKLKPLMWLSITFCCCCCSVKHFYFFKHLYWSITALQWCVSSCFITKWISYTYTYIPISLPSCFSLPPSLSHPSRWSQSTELISLCYAAASH